MGCQMCPDTRPAPAWKQAVQNTQNSEFRTGFLFVKTNLKPKMTTSALKPDPRVKGTRIQYDDTKLALLQSY